MTKTIYADVLFSVNFIINYLILFTASKIGAVHIRRLRLVCASLLGALWSVLSLLPRFEFMFSAVLKLLLSLIMCLISFGVRKILKNTLLFLGTSLAFGGVIFAVSLLGSGAFEEIRGGVYYMNASLPMLLILAFCAYVLLSLIFCRAGTTPEKKITSISLSSAERTITLRALHDTGNSLRAPTTNAPVVVTDYHASRELFPPDARDILDETAPAAFPQKLPSLSSAGDFSLIPYKTVGKEFALMLTFRPDKILIDGRELHGALLAINEASVSDGASYNAII